MQIHANPHFLPLLCALALPAAGCGKPDVAANPPAPRSFDFSAPRVAWSHLDPPARAAIDAGLAKRALPDLIILHSTGSPAVSASALADNHTRVRGLAGGLAYHFVIGNGRGIPDGHLITGPRWSGGQPSQALADPAGEANALTIALTGDFNRTPPTPAQLDALDELLDYLEAKTGPVKIRLHREVETCPRQCPGKLFPVKALRAAHPL